jgi:protein-S-isoprenylcysteine O-methyltransferase Ste14
MTNAAFLARHGIARNAIREDLLFFALPFLVVFVVGLLVSARDAYDGLVATLWNLVRQPQNVFLLTVPNIVGLVLLVSGLTVALIAIGTLKRFYLSTLVIRQDHQLITHGIYGITRHPIYLGVITVVFGVPVYASSLYGLLAMSALLPVFLNRIRIEERLLTEEFGDAYRTYQETTSKLIPFIC